MTEHPVFDLTLGLASLAGLSWRNCVGEETSIGAKRWSEGFESVDETRNVEGANVGVGDEDVGGGRNVGEDFGEDGLCKIITNPNRFLQL